MNQPTATSAAPYHPARGSALPGWAIDVIRDGVPKSDLKANGGRAALHELRRTALSAQLHGQDRAEWLALVSDPYNALARQYAMSDGRKPKKALSLHRNLLDIWEKAAEYLSTLPGTWTGEEVAAQAHLRADAIDSLVANPHVDLTEPERAVLTYAAQQARERGMLRVALPRRAVMEATNLGERATRTALTGLDWTRLLTLAIPGRGGKARIHRRANIYALAELPAIAAYRHRDPVPQPGQRPSPTLERARTADRPVTSGHEKGPDPLSILNAASMLSVARRNGSFVIQIPDNIPWEQALQLIQGLPTMTPEDTHTMDKDATP